MLHYYFLLVSVPFCAILSAKSVCLLTRTNAVRMTNLISCLDVNICFLVLLCFSGPYSFTFLFPLNNFKSLKAANTLRKLSVTFSVENINPGLFSAFKSTLTWQNFISFFNISTGFSEQETNSKNFCLQTMFNKEKKETSISSCLVNLSDFDKVAIAVTYHLFWIECVRLISNIPFALNRMCKIDTKHRFVIKRVLISYFDNLFCKLSLALRHYSSSLLN